MPTTYYLMVQQNKKREIFIYINKANTTKLYQLFNLDEWYGI